MRISAYLLAVVLAKTLPLVFANPNPNLGPWYISYLQGTSGITQTQSNPNALIRLTDPRAAGPDGPWNVIQLPVDFPDEVREPEAGADPFLLFV